MNKEKYLFPNAENVINIGEVPTSHEYGYTYLEQVILLREWVIALKNYESSQDIEIKKNTDNIEILLNYEHITKLYQSNYVNVTDLPKGIYLAKERIHLLYKQGFGVELYEGDLILVQEEVEEKNNTKTHYLFSMSGTIGNFQNVRTTFTNDEVTEVKFDQTDLFILTDTLNRLQNDITENTRNIETNTANIQQNTNSINDLNTKTTNNTNAITGLDTRISNIENNPYTLPIASDTTLGGIKVGSNLSINSEGVLSANSSESELDKNTYILTFNSTELKNVLLEIRTKVHDNNEKVLVYIDTGESGQDNLIPSVVYAGNQDISVSTSRILSNNSEWEKLNTLETLSLYTTTDYATAVTKTNHSVVVPTTSNVLTLDNTTEYTPTADYQPATKKYVDNKTYTLPIASNSTLGGVKIGEGIDVTSEGVISADTNIGVGEYLTKSDLKKIYNAYINGKNYNIFNTYEKYRYAGYSIGGIRVIDTQLNLTIIRNMGKYADVLTYSYDASTDTITSVNNKTYDYVIGSSTDFALKRVEENGTPISPNLVLSRIDPNTYKSRVYKFLTTILKYTQYDFEKSSGGTLLVSNYSIYDNDTTTTTPVVYKLSSINCEFAPNGNNWDLTDVFVFINKDLSYTSETKDKYNVIEYKMKSNKAVGKIINNMYLYDIFGEDSEITLNQYDYYVSKSENVSNETSTNKKFSFDFLFNDDDSASIGNYNESSYIMTGISKSFDVNEIYGELMVKYSEVIGGNTYSSVCPADRLKYMLTNVSDIDYSFRTLTDGTTQLSLFIRRNNNASPWSSPVGIKLENIFINGYFLNSTEDVSKSTTISQLTE